MLRQQFIVPDSLKVFTVRGYAGRYGIPMRTAYDQVRKLFDTGQIEIAFERGRTTYYRILKERK